ncbi:uncharacterized protein EV422DRAFT_568197 [Fimicolochytrium jonesii]|uniref:uncharacterized protein n=1 Tax=Fimicolochytrium jonesii TaxID=1396493 RepID=UPI0022FF2F1A|nr:uncharacterized protein EV422DRAFT_568197 [Fimicolochytrium jonesii]KAI8820232.1 hypothetical protein EV422DRAFT_568197 [Fimicolochytrium jonesii]
MVAVREYARALSSPKPLTLFETSTATKTSDTRIRKNMWKSATGTEQKPAKPSDDDDWDTDPDFVNDVSERDQRWGNQKTIDTQGAPKTELTMDELRKQVIEKNEKAAKDEWIRRNGKDVKESYGVGKNGKV